MAAFLDFAKMTVTNTPGNTLAFALGAAAFPYQTFAAAGAVDGVTYSYVAAEGAIFEVGRGKYTAAGTTLSRDTIFDSSAGFGTKATFSSQCFVWATPIVADMGTGSIYVNASQKIITNGFYLCDTSGGSFTLTLPAVPTTGANFTFIDPGTNWAANNLILDPGSNTIQGFTGTFNCDVNNMEFTIMWNGSDWRLV